jgi:hypothetical protein
VSKNFGANASAPTSTAVIARPTMNAFVRICVLISRLATSINPFTPRPP